MKCSVIRSSIRDFTYIYLVENGRFEDLPVALRNVFGEPEFVMSLELSADRKLAYENVETVLYNLTEQGYHLQMPPTDDPSGLLDLPEKKETLL